MAEMTPPPVRLTVLRHPFRREREVVEAPFGQTLEALAAAQGLADAHAIAMVGDVVVPRTAWKYLKPKPGVDIILRRVPEKGGKSGLGALLSIASLFVPAFGPTISLFEGTAFATSFSLGQMAVKGALFLASAALSRPPSQRLGGHTYADQPSFQITGGSNKAIPYGPVPRLYGRHRIYPPLAATPYTETVGGKHYLNMLFDFGYGPLKFEDFRIGATPIANYTGVEMEVRAGYADDAPMTLYRNDVAPQSLSIVIKNADGPRILETALATDEVTIGLVYSQGLTAFNAETGARMSRTVRVKLDYRLAGTADAWSNIGVQGGAVVPTTAGSQIASTASSKTWRTDLPSTGTIDLQINVGLDEHWRVSTRSEGASTWVQQAVVECSPEGGYWYNQDGLTMIWINEAGVRTVNLVVTPGVRSEILIEQAPSAYTPAAPVVVGLSYNYVDNGYYDFTAAQATPFLTDARIRFPVRAKYEVRLQRVSEDSGSDTVRDVLTWSVLNSITYTSPIAVSGHALVALRILASEQLNGVLQEFSAIASALLKTWDGAVWTDYVETANPAWAYADILCGSANARPIDRARLDAAAIKVWADDCAAAGLQFNAPFDFRTTVFEAARDVAAVGRASFHMRDGLYSIVQDKPQSVPVQVFTPRNSWGYSGSKRFVELPHALKVRFYNRDKDWQQDQRIVCDDGYTEQTATVFEVLELFGVDNADQVWKEGRRQIANARLRPEEHTFYADVEHIVCNRGDLIRFSHDVIMAGLGFGRLKSVTLNGSNEATAATLDAEIVMEAGKSYVLRIRLNDGSSVVAPIVTAAGGQTAVTFSPAIAAADVPAAGDLITFGEVGQDSLALLVTAIEPRADLSALIKCVDAAPAVHTADSGAIPPWNSQISLPAVWQRRPARPIIQGIASDESVLILTPDGGYRAVMQLTISIPGGGVLPAVGLEVAWRADDEDAWQVLSLPAVSPQSVTLDDAVAGTTYQIRARTHAAAGASSDWTETSHTVIGASTAPPAVTNLLLRNGALIWSHAQPRDHAGYVVRYRFDMLRHWDTAAAAHLGLVTATPFQVDSIIAAGGIVTFLVEAVDLAGNPSGSPASLIVNLGDAITDNVILTHDLHPTFAGTIDGGAVESSELKAGDTAAFWGAAAAPFWGPPEAAFWDTQYGQMTYTFSITPTADEAGDGRVLLAYDVSGDGYTIEFKMGGSEEPFWGAAEEPFWGVQPDWSAWPGELSPIPAARIDFRFTLSGGSRRGIIHTLSVLLDVPDVVEYLEDVAVSSAGTTRLLLTKTFRAITAVNLTLQDIGTGARSVIAFDKDAVNGPLVKAYDGAGTLVNASADAIVQGH